MKKLLAVLLAGLMLLSLCACAGETPAKKPAGNEASGTEVGDPTEKAIVTEAPETEPVTEATEEPKPAATEISLNEKIQLDFVEITFEEYGIAADIQQSIKSDIVTRITGPQPENGKQFVYLRGTIKNVHKEGLPTYDFFIGEFDVDGYKFDCSANECDILNENGETQWEIAPLTSYSFTMYAKIPDELANPGSVSFRFGFYDLFDNYELSYNRSFEDDPISLCPYQYALTLAE